MRVPDAGTGTHTRMPPPPPSLSRQNGTTQAPISPPTSQPSASADWRGPAWESAANTMRSAAQYGQAGAQMGAAHAVTATSKFTRAVAIGWDIYKRNVAAFIVPFCVYGVVILILAAIGAFAPALNSLKEILSWVVLAENYGDTDTHVGTGLGLVVSVLLVLGSTPLLMVPAILMSGGQVNVATRAGVGQEKPEVWHGFYAAPLVLLMLLATNLFENFLGLFGLIPGIVASFFLIYSAPAVARGIGPVLAVRTSVTVCLKNPAVTALVLAAAAGAFAVSGLVLFLPLVIVLPMEWIVLCCLFDLLGGPHVAEQHRYRSAIARAAKNAQANPGAGPFPQA
jgi:uncharacterized membrane protein